MLCTLEKQITNTCFHIKELQSPRERERERSKQVNIKQNVIDLVIEKEAAKNIKRINSSLGNHRKHMKEVILSSAIRDHWCRKGGEDL